MMTAEDARAEAERRYKRQTMHIGTAQDREIAAFVAGAEWARAQVLAQVRAGIEAIPSTPWFKADALDAIDALAVLDRAASETGESNV